MAALETWLQLPSRQQDLQQQAFATQPLSKSQAEQTRRLLIAEDARQTKAHHEEEWKKKQITLGELNMKFDYTVFADKPADGRSLFISMHGGGNTSKSINDQQWENQKKLYKPIEGVYLAPRAPNDAWNMWFQPHMDAFFSRLIQDAAVFEEVNVDKVYLMGYSAGGDGVFRMAPRMAHRWAAAAMMAGHPGDVRADNLRNLPFTLHMGENDKAYDRNKQALVWKKLLLDLREQDPHGYTHEVVIQPGMGHWMQRKDAIAIPWMMKFTRNTVPRKIVWVEPLQPSFYWLAQAEFPADKLKAAKMVATVDQQNISIESEHFNGITLRLRDDLINLDQPISIRWNGKLLPEKSIHRTISTQRKTLLEHHDKGLCFDAEVKVQAP
ncbi:MAG: dienelactone hydrolase family protein [Planctomycetia bacterium]|nr:dienelactone hydrolase family protein [Planctomycetia bacterium]